MGGLAAKLSGFEFGTKRWVHSFALSLNSEQFKRYFEQRNACEYSLSSPWPCFLAGFTDSKFTRLHISCSTKRQQTTRCPWEALDTTMAKGEQPPEQRHNNFVMRELKKKILCMFVKILLRFTLSLDCHCILKHGSQEAKKILIGHVLYSCSLCVQ